MSSILKALQRLEQDRAVRRNGPPDIEAGLLTPQKPTKRHWPMLAGMLAIAGTTAIVTYALMGGFSLPRRQAPSSSPRSPLPPTAASRSEAQPMTVIVAPQPRLPVPPHRRPSTESTLPAAAGAVPSPPPSTRPASPEKEPVGTHAAQSATSPAPPASPIRVSGIAWQKDGSTPVAVVNGMAVSEGGTVAGARVEKIFPDRVRFTRGDRHFDVSLGGTATDGH